MADFKSIFKTDITDSLFVETFALKRSDFTKMDIMPPKHGKGFLVVCSDSKLFNSLVLLDDSEEKAKQSHDCTVAMVKKSLEKSKS